MERGNIYIPDNFSGDEKKLVMNIIEDQIKIYPIIASDCILVDELNGEINIKIFKREEIEKLCKEKNLSEYEILMRFMRAQNNFIKK